MNLLDVKTSDDLYDLLISIWDKDNLFQNLCECGYYDGRERTLFEQELEQDRWVYRLGNVLVDGVNPELKSPYKIESVACSFKGNDDKSYVVFNLKENNRNLYFKVWYSYSSWDDGEYDDEFVFVSPREQVIYVFDDDEYASTTKSLLDETILKVTREIM